MAEPDPDNRGADPESMFDFLNEHDERRPFGKIERAEPGETTALPIIRAPVPVSSSGPLRAPRAGEPLNLAPPFETDGRRVDVQRQSAPSRPRSQNAAREQAAADLQKPARKDSDPDGIGRPITSVPAPTNVTRFPGPARSATVDRERLPESLDADDTLRLSSGTGTRGRPGTADELDDDFAFLTKSEVSDRAQGFGPRSSDGFVEAFDDDVLAGVHDADAAEAGRWRMVTALGGILLALAGAGLVAQRYLFEPQPAPYAGSEPAELEPIGSDQSAVVAAQTAPQSLGDRFRERLTGIQTLLDDGRVDDAARAIAELDRSIYGYGAAEFGAIEQRIAAFRDTGELPPTVSDTSAAQADQAKALAEADARRAEQEQRATQVAAERLAEQQRLAQIAAEAERVAAQVEVERIAAARALEEQRLADTAATLEVERVAAARALQEQRLASEALAVREAEAEAAVAATQARTAAERDAREEAERVASAESRRLAEQRAAEAKAATDRRIAAQRAETQRRAAAEQASRDRADAEARVQQQRAAAVARQAQRERGIAQREAAARAEAAAERLARAESLAAPEPRTQPQPSIAPRPIGDDDLRTVYERFVSLEAAIEARDINAVIALTQPSGARVQQFLQLFQNSRAIAARITGVSTRNVSGSITGTLRIDSIERNDGRSSVPSDALASITLTSQRSGNGWSVIDW